MDSAGSGGTAFEFRHDISVPPPLLRVTCPERGLVSKCAPSLDMKRGLSPNGAEAGGAHKLWVQHPAYQRHNNNSNESASSQDSAYISCYDSVEDLRDPKDGSGTEHTDLPQLPESAEHKQEEDGSLLGNSESWPRHEIEEESQDPQNGSATKGKELSQVQDPAGHKLRDFIWKSETRPRKEEAVVEIPEDALGPQDGSATRGTELPQVQDPVGHRQGEAVSLLEQRESWPGDRIGEKSQDGSAMGITWRKNFRECLGDWFGSHPVLTLVLLIVLSVLAFVFGLSLAAVSGRTQTEIPVTPVSPVTPVIHDTPQLLACPKGWVGYRGICYFLSRAHRSWDQAQALCSELGASLAVLKDLDMELLFRLSGKDNPWLGLRRHGQGLQWVDGSSFNSSVPVLGNAGCVFLAENHFGSLPCSTEMRYICSRPQSHL